MQLPKDFKFKNLTIMFKVYLIPFISIWYFIHFFSLEKEIVNELKGRSQDLEYEEVKIGRQTWMKKNLNVSRFRNGDQIPQAKTSKEFEDAGWKKEPAWCYYNFDPKNGEKYGKLYNWYAVIDPRGLAPNGWEIPTSGDWYELREYLGGELEAIDQLKSKTGWLKKENGNNKSGFSGLPGGYWSEIGGDLSNPSGFYPLNDVGVWWSATERSSELVSAYRLGRRFFQSDVNKREGYSVRCIKEPEEYRLFDSGKKKWDTRDFQGAIHDFSKGIEINPDEFYFPLYYWRARSKRQLKDYTGALEDLNVILLIENFWDLDKELKYLAYYYRGVTHSNIGNQKEAILDLTKAIELGIELGSNSATADAYLLRGGARELENQKDLACLDFSKAIELGVSEKFLGYIKEYCK